MTVLLIGMLATASFQVSSDYEIVEVWQQEVAAPTDVAFRAGHLMIGDEAVSPLDGSPVSIRSLEYTVAQRPRPDFKIETLEDDLPISIGYKRFYSAANYHFAFSGPVDADGNIGQVTGIAKLDHDGTVIEEHEASRKLEPLFMAGPVRITPYIESGFIFAQGEPTLDGKDSRHHAIILTEPLRMSPLNVALYHDLNVPDRSLGVYMMPFSQYHEHSLLGAVHLSPAVCGNIFTGRVYWVLGDEFKWVKRVGEHILAYDSRNKYWCVVNEEDGFVARIIPRLLDRIEPDEDVDVIDGKLVVIRRFGESYLNPDYRTVTTYELRKAR